MTRHLASASFHAFFLLALAFAAAGFLVPMERPPYQLSHPSTYAPVMVEGGLAFVLFLAAWDGRPSLARAAAALWAGAAVWAAATCFDQNFVDFFLRVPLAAAAAVATFSAVSGRGRTPFRSAASATFWLCLLVTLFVHYAFLFPVNWRIDADRLAAVERAVASEDLLSATACSEPGFECFTPGAPPREVPPGDMEMIASYAAQARSLSGPVIRRVVSPDAVNVQSDYRLYGIVPKDGSVAIAMSGKRHLIGMRIIANNGMMASLGFFFAVCAGWLIRKAAWNPSLPSRPPAGA